jgi:hypothetical protein
MGIDWGVVVGFIGLIFVVVGAVIARDRQITNMIHKNHNENTDAVTDAAKLASDEAKEIHSRINRLREHSDNEFVRRADLDGHLQRIEKGVADMRTEMRADRTETHSRLDAVLTAISKTN